MLAIRTLAVPGKWASADRRDEAVDGSRPSRGARRPRRVRGGGALTERSELVLAAL